MPQVFKVGSYWVYFWANENEPLEPIHVHVAGVNMSRQQKKRKNRSRTDRQRLQMERSS